MNWSIAIRVGWHRVRSETWFLLSGTPGFVLLSGQRQDQFAGLKFLLKNAFLVGVAISLWVAICQSATIGPKAAFLEFCFWWLAIPVLTTLTIPLLFVIILVASVLTVALFLPLLVPGWMFNRDPFSYLHKVLFALTAGVLIWALSLYAVDAAQPMGTAHLQPSLPKTAAPTPSSSTPSDLFAWLRSNVVALALGGLLLKVLESIAAEWVKRRFAKSEAVTQARAVPLYGANGELIRSVTLERAADRT